MAKIKLDWKPASTLPADSPARLLMVYNSKETEMPMPLIWKHNPGDPGPYVAGFDWYAEFDGFELPVGAPL